MNQVDGAAPTVSIGDVLTAEQAKTTGRPMAIPENTNQSASDAELYEIAVASGMSHAEAEVFIEEYRKSDTAETVLDQTSKEENEAGVSTMLQSKEKKDNDYGDYIGDDYGDPLKNGETSEY